MPTKQSSDVAVPRGGPLSSLRIMDILSALASNAKGTKLSELSVELDIPRTSLLSLLRGLIQGQYVRQTDSGYVLGEETLRFCAKAYQNNNLPDRARPVLKLLASETRETIALSVLAEDRRSLVYIEVVESPSPLRFAPQKGDTRPLFATSPGQVLLAYLSDDELKEYLKGAAFERFTADTITRQQLRGRIDAIREAGYALNFDGMTHGVTSAACPVFDSSGRVVCVLSAAGPAARFAESKDKIVEATCVAGGELSRMLGYVAPTQLVTA